MTLTKILEHILKAIQDMGMTEVQSKIAKCVKVESQTFTSDEKAQARTNIGAIAEIPTASADTLGGVKVGSGLSITEGGVLSASGGGGSASLFVDCEDEGGIITPKSGQPSATEIQSAVLAGTLVVVKTTNLETGRVVIGNVAYNSDLSGIYVPCWDGAKFYYLSFE